MFKNQAISFDEYWAENRQGGKYIIDINYKFTLTDIINTLKDVLEAKDIVCNIAKVKRIAWADVTLDKTLEPDDVSDIIYALAEDLELFFAQKAEFFWSIGEPIRYDIDEENFRHLANIIKPAIEKLEAYQQNLAENNSKA